MIQFANIDSFDKLVEAIDTEYPDYRTTSMAQSECGEWAVEIVSRHYSRPIEFDMAVVEKAAIQDIARQLDQYLEHTQGPIYWRIRPEHEWSDAPRVIRFDAEGPDRDFITGRKCFLDKEWKSYCVYMWLARESDHRAYLSDQMISIGAMLMEAGILAKRNSDPEFSRIVNRELKEVPRSVIAAHEWGKNEAQVLSERLSRRFDVGAAMNEATQRAIEAKKAAKDEGDIVALLPTQAAALEFQKEWLSRAIRNA